MKNDIKIPTLKEKVKMYEDFLHQLSLYVTCGDSEKIRQLVHNADNFSYSHRIGNGEYSDKIQSKIIAAKFWKLLEIKD